MPGRFLTDRRGGVAVMGAAAGAVICVVAAFGVDLGSVALEARKVQGAADLAALSAAMNLPRAHAAAKATATDNLGKRADVETEVGFYAPDRALAPDARFSAGGATANAARVRIKREARLYFARWIVGRDTVTVSRSATAALEAVAPTAAFSLGSRLASLDGGLLNQFLSQLTGSRVALNVMDYRRLADLDVDLLTYLDALAAELDVEAGDYDALLRHHVDAGRAVKVLETVAGGADGGALGALGRAGAGLDLDLGRLVGVEADAGEGLAKGLKTQVSALDLATTMLELASDKRQAALSLDAPTGLTDVKISAAIGERPNHSPWISLSADHGTTIRTAQTRLYVRARTAQSLSGLGQLEVPILVELAQSEARLDAIRCPQKEVDLGVRPGLAQIFIGAVDEHSLDDFKTPLKPRQATLLSLLRLVTIQGKAEVSVANRDFKSVRFSNADIEQGRYKTVGVRETTQSLSAGLIDGLKLDVSVGPLGIGLGDVAGAVGRLLRPLAPAFDAVLNSAADLLGVGLGEADAAVHGVKCGDRLNRPVLVG